MCNVSPTFLCVFTFKVTVIHVACIGFQDVCLYGLGVFVVCGLCGGFICEMKKNYISKKEVPRSQP